MAKHQHYDYSQSVIAPIFLEDQLLPGTLEYAIHYIGEERLNMSIFNARYNDDNTGRRSDDNLNRDCWYAGPWSCRFRPPDA